MLGKTLIQKGGMILLSTSLHLWVPIETVRVKAHNPMTWCTIGCWSPIKWIKDTRLESIKLREESTEQEWNRYFLYGNKAKAGKWDCAGLYSFYIGERMSMGVKWPTRAWRERLAKHNLIRNYCPYTGNVCNSEAKTKLDDKWQVTQRDIP